nr:mucin-2-like [Parasteatoda tepidariorum]
MSSPPPPTTTPRLKFDFPDFEQPIITDFPVPEGSTRPCFSANPTPVHETTTPEQPSPPVESPIMDMEETTQVPEAINITPPTEMEQNLVPIEEASAHESGKSTSNNKEPPPKKRKKKKLTNATKTTAGLSPTSSNSSSPSESLSQPEPTTNTAAETTNETPDNDKETSKVTEKALPTKHAKILIRGLPDDFDTEIISQDFGKLDLKLHKIIQFKKREGGSMGSSPFL